MPQRRSAKTAPAPTPPPPLQPAPDRHAAILRDAGLRVTGVRRSILGALEAAPGPINAQQVFDAVLLRAAKGERRPDRVTVYRTLNALVDSGLAHRVDPGDRVFRFSLTDHAGCSHDRHVHEHPHFVCDDCGKVECLEGAQVIIRDSDPAADPARARKVRQSETVLHGTCGQCDTPRPRKA